MKLISIITPAYNVEPYIRSTIESVLSQTYENWEMLIVDDASTDETAKIAEEYATGDARIKVIRYTENQGAAAARNTALSRARGEYIAILDGDDMWLPEKLDRQYRFMEDNGYVLTYTAYQKYISKFQEKGKVAEKARGLTTQGDT